MTQLRGPLHRLADRPGEALAELAAGFRADEDGEVARLKAENAKLRRDLEEQRDLLREARSLADQDPLVPILNRRAFVNELGRIIARVERYGEEANLIYIDLDGLKQINDTLGHIAGDAVLAHVGQQIVKAIRKSDVAGRLGGDEFAVVAGRGDEDEAEAMAKRIAAAVAAQEIVWRGERIRVSFSYGVCRLEAGMRAEQALDRADAAMYENKRAAAAGRPTR